MLSKSRISAVHFIIQCVTSGDDALNDIKEKQLQSQSYLTLQGWLKQLKITEVKKPSFIFLNLISKRYDVLFIENDAHERLCLEIT